MSKQKRTSSPERSEEVARGAEIADHEVDLGNSAAWQELSSGADERVALGLDVVRDAASPLVERAILALQIEPRDGRELARFVEILDGSRLPADRRALLVDHLQTDQAAARGIADAVERWFAGDTSEIREVVVDALDAVRNGLDGGSAGPEGWVLPDGGWVPIGGGHQDSVSDRAEALLAAIAERSAPAGLAERLGPVDRSVGESVRGFVRDVQLALLWDEEEEEERGDGSYAAEESGA